MKLYQLTERLNRLQDAGEEMDKELFEDTLQSIVEPLEEKAENISLLIRNLTAEGEAIKAEEKRLADRRKAAEKKVAWLKEYLQGQLEKAGIDKIKRPTITIALQNNPPSVKVTDEGLLVNYMVPVPPKLDRKTLLADLKTGKEIPGAELTQGKGLRIR